MTRYGFLSSYPPTRCGLATFTEALAAAIVEDDGPYAEVVRVIDTMDPRPAAPVGTRTVIVGELVADDPRTLLSSAARLNACDVAIVQHEYGIYGGPDGDQVITLLEALNVPIIVVFHTVLASPTARQRTVLERVGALATEIVVMTETARSLVEKHYAIDIARVRVVPHGVATWLEEASEVAHETPRVLTWGLIGPGKGLEWGIRAMALLADMVPAPEYTVVGQTHPKVLANDGDVYREMLQRTIDELGLQETVTLDARYLDSAQLAAMVSSADVVLLPYDSLEQVTSGVLVEAIAAGVPVVATGFPHAVELLADGAGRIVTHRNPESMAEALREVLTRSDVANQMRAAALQSARETSWPAVAEQYRLLAAQVLAAEAA